MALLSIRVSLPRQPNPTPAALEKSGPDPSLQQSGLALTATPAAELTQESRWRLCGWATLFWEPIRASVHLFHSL